MSATRCKSYLLIHSSEWVGEAFYYLCNVKYGIHYCTHWNDLCPNCVHHVFIIDTQAGSYVAQLEALTGNGKILAGSRQWSYESHCMFIKDLTNPLDTNFLFLYTYVYAC